MNTIQLRCFLSVAEYLSFARASEQLNMTQPAISHQIASLEKELDTKLFIRTTRTVILTQEGAVFYDDAKKLIQIMYTAKNRVKNLNEQTSQIFNIGIHTYPELKMVSQILTALSPDFPLMRPNIKMLPSKSLRNLLDTKDIHAMLSYRIETSIKEPGVYEELCQCSLSCVAPSSHAFSQKNCISLADLNTEHLILYETHKNPPAISHLQTYFVETHAPHKLTYTDNPSCALALVSAGFGITVIPDLPPLRNPMLSYIPIQNSALLSYGIYYHSLKEQPILKHFIEQMKLLFSS